MKILAGLESYINLQYFLLIVLQQNAGEISCALPLVRCPMFGSYTPYISKMGRLSETMY